MEIKFLSVCVCVHELVRVRKWFVTFFSLLASQVLEAVVCWFI